MREYYKKYRGNLPHIVTQQGKPVREHVFLVKKYNDIALVTINFRSKWLDIGFIGSAFECPLIGVVGTDRSKFLSRAESDYTEILFNTFRGWKIFSVDISRYTCRIALISGWRSVASSGQKSGLGT